VFACCGTVGNIVGSVERGEIEGLLILSFLIVFYLLNLWMILCCR